MIVIVDYGMGNLNSVKKALTRLGHQATVSNCAGDIRCASRLILPGVGHFREGMAGLEKNSLLEPLQNAVVRERVPVLGICLGMQLMTLSSDECDRTKGLGWVPLRTGHFPNTGRIIPHMGWNGVSGESLPLMEGIDDDKQFYFVHSFQVRSGIADGLKVGTTWYGNEFVSTFSYGNIHGVQFHPEKSHLQGLTLLSNFLKVR